MTAAPRLTKQDISALEGAERKATPGPWHYRPHEYDDWGWIRGPKDDDERGDSFPGWTVCCARSGGPDRPEDRDRHRVEGSDPYGHNAAFIAALRNAAPDLIRRARRLEEAQSHIAALARPGQLELQFGGMSAQEKRTARAIIGWFETILKGEQA